MTELIVASTAARANVVDLTEHRVRG